MIIKTFNGKTESDIASGLVTQVSWDKLLPHIGEAIMLRDNEVIDGLAASEEGIKVSLSYKRGRRPDKNGD